MQVLVMSYDCGGRIASVPACIYSHQARDIIAREIAGGGASGNGTTSYRSGPAHGI